MRNFFAFAACLLLSLPLRAQCPNPNCTGSKTLNISTGIDAAGNFLAAGNIDPFWQLMNYPPLESPCSNPPAVTIPNCNVVSPISSAPAWLNLNGGGQGIISANTSNEFDCDNMFGDQPWRFRRYFCVCKASNVLISGAVRMDDYGKLNVYNVSGGAALFSVNIPAGFIYADKTFSGILSLPAGTYYLEAELVNKGHHYSGFVLKGSIATTPGGNTLFNAGNACCANTGSITVQKILETKICNGITDAGEMPGSGWVFNLLNAGGTVIQTQTTNSVGEASFSGLAPGSYTVTEQVQGGWYCNSPSGGSQNVSVTASGVVTLTFYNCKGSPPQSTGAYCCDGKNLVKNPSFEDGNTGFSSQYGYQNTVAANSVIPGQYAILTSANAAAICNKWQLKDHTFCAAGYNSKVLVINGETTQPSNASNIIWQQNVGGLEPGQDYKFCAYMKNFPACCFDVKPKVKVDATPGSSSGWVVVDAGTGACDWQLVEFSFTATSASVNLQIFLEETTKGDGNDLAIDDISLQKLPKSTVMISVQNQSITPTSCQITASINSISNGDDALPHNSCKYVWVIGNLSTISPPAFSGTPIFGGSMGYSTWGLTTTFPGFTCTPKQPYLIYLYVYDCDCLATGYDYQITLDNGRVQKLSANEEALLHKKVAELIKSKQ